jgi:signal transduction histidine kinase
MIEPIKIVIVEDDPGLNELIKRHLKREGHDCSGFQKAGEAVAWLSGNKADLMIIDLVLPDCSGEEMLNMLHRNNINIPYIVATGQGSEATAVKMLKKGARDYMVKNSEFLDVLPATIDMVWREIQLEGLLEMAREKIQVQNATLSAVNEYSPDGILVLDPMDNIISYNHHLLEMWDLAKTSVLTSGAIFFRDISEKFSAPSEFINKINTLPVDSKGLIFEEIKYNGNRFELYTSPIDDEEQKPFGRIWFFRDISIHKEAQELIEENAKMRSRFFALVSHDLKSPLNSINGFIDLLATSELDEKQKEFVDTIKSSSNHLLILINDILDFSKIEYGAMEFHIDKVPVQEIFKDCVTSFMPEAEQTGIKLSCEIAKNVPASINGDILRLRQIVINFLSNAIKFTHEGYVRLTAKPHDDNFIMVEVCDSGIGISKEAQKHIFSPFTQAGADVAQSYGGSGLGLAICKELIEAMGGNLNLESEKGKGTTFSFTIPIDMNQYYKRKET